MGDGIKLAITIIIVVVMGAGVIFMAAGALNMINDLYSYYYPAGLFITGFLMFMVAGMSIAVFNLE